MEQRKFNSQRLFQFLERLESSPSDYLTVYVRPSSFPHTIIQATVEYSYVAQGLKKALGTEAVWREAGRYGTGAVIFWSQTDCKNIILPPYSLAEDMLFTGKPQTSILKGVLYQEYPSGVVLMTWGSYGIGVFKGDQLLDYRTGTGYIYKRHRKGGRSEKRFARRTEEQKKDFLGKVASHIEEGFRVHHLEQIFFGGNRLLLRPLLTECPFLQSRVQQISRRFLNVRYVDEKTLLRSVEDINSSLVFEF